MRKIVLVMGIACASWIAVAQSSTPQNENANRVVAPRDHATGQASGKREAGSGQASGQAAVQSARETGTGMTTGRTMAPEQEQDQLKHKNTMSGASSNPMYTQSGNTGTNPLYEAQVTRATKTRSNIQNNRMATGDVDSDGAAEKTVVKSKSNITNNRDQVTGQASGKQHN